MNPASVIVATVVATSLTLVVTTVVEKVVTVRRRSPAPPRPPVRPRGYCACCNRRILLANDGRFITHLRDIDADEEIMCEASGLPYAVFVINENPFS